MIRLIREHPIQAFALLCVTATSIFFGYMALKVVNILSSPDWCSKALQADRITPDSSFDGLTACVGLLTIQLKSLATNSHIIFVVFALCLCVLVVVVIAGAKLSGKYKDAELAIERDDDVNIPRR